MTSKRCGGVLKRLREAKGLTQQALADKAKVTDAYIAQLETGVRTNPTMDTRKQLAKALTVPVRGVGEVVGGDVMKAVLSPEWELSTEHAASSYSQPVLVHRSTGRTFGPRDLVVLYPSHGPAPAAEGVRRLAKTAKLDADGAALVAQFVETSPAL